MQTLVFVLALAANSWLAGAQSDASGSVQMFQYLGCYTDPGNPRALTYQIGTTGGSDAATIETCYDACSATYQYFGLEYHGQCWCADTLDPASQAAPHDDCNTPCNGNANEWCGGPDRLSLYSLNGVAPGGSSGSGGGSGGNAYSASQASVASSRSMRSMLVSQSKASVASSRSARSYSVSVSKADYVNSRASVSGDKSRSRASHYSSQSAASASRSNARASASSSASAASASRQRARDSVSERLYGTAPAGGGGTRERRRAVEAGPMPVEEAMATITEPPSLEDRDDDQEAAGEFVWY